MIQPRILVACIGNIFLGDDAFGVELAKVLRRRSLPPESLIVDFGICGMDLALAMGDGYQAVVLVDALPRGQLPGTLYVLEVDTPTMADPASMPAPDAHSLDPAKVLQLAAAMGCHVGRVLVVGCEPTPLPEEDMAMELSGPVFAALEPAANLVESVVESLLACPDGELNLARADGARKES